MREPVSDQDQDKEPTRTLCPQCEQEILLPERFCPNCGRDGLWLPRSLPTFRRTPPGLDVSHFQVEEDRAATRALSVATPVQWAVRYYLRRVAEPEYRNQLLANAVRVTASQSPRLYHLAKHCESILHTAPIEVYVYNSPEATTFSFGSGQTDVIVITSTLADFIPDDDELLFLLGSQLGHVKADHVVYLTVAKALGTALRGIPALGSALSGAANFLLVPWERTATLTADRAGLLCSQNLVASGRAMAKMQLGFGDTVGKLDFEEFLRQARDLEREGDWGDTWKTQPALARRLRLLQEFYLSPQWARIFEGAWDPLSPRFRCFYCSGGGSPSSPSQPLSELTCRACGRDLMVEELPCPRCCAPLPVSAEQSLQDLHCKACDTDYMSPDLEARFRGELAQEALRSSAYRTLGITPTATPAGLRRAFRDRMQGLENRVAGVGGGNPVEEKIHLYAAFKTLIDPRRRRQHDLRLEFEQWLGEHAPSELDRPRCGSCEAPRRGPICGLCGWKEASTGEGTPGAWFGRFQEVLQSFARADEGELLTENGGTFDLAFHRGRRALFFSRRKDLDRPGSLRNLLRAASETLTLARPGTQARFFALVEGHLDEPLLLRLLADLPRALQLRLLVPSHGGKGFQVLEPANRELRRQHFEDPQLWLREELELG